MINGINFYSVGAVHLPQLTAVMMSSCVGKETRQAETEKQGHGRHDRLDCNVSMTGMASRFSHRDHVHNLQMTDQWLHHAQ